MMTYEAAKQLFDGAGLPLTESHFAQFQCYLAELTETNRHMNLTAITEPAEAWEKHFLDCAILLQKVQLPLGATCIDVGTGAGFPGMVLALLRPDLQVTLLDSLQKTHRVSGADGGKAGTCQRPLYPRQSRGRGEAAGTAGAV